VSAYDRVLDAVRSAGLRTFEASTGARAQCPGHQSRGLSLSLRPAKEEDGPVGLKCFANCEAVDVLAAIGLTLKDLYEPRDPRDRTPPRPRRKPTPYEKEIPNAEHFCDRAQKEQALESFPAYWEMRAEQLAGGLPRPTDRIVVGDQTDRIARITNQMIACRNHADVLRRL
jgi:hypothetical protein